MGISEKLQYAQLDKLYLDAKNPRLGRPEANATLSQEQVLDRMRNWTLEELAASYLESGFWTHEALLVVEEELDGHPRLVVVEGNRRLAALRYLYAAQHGEKVSRKWELLVQSTEVPETLFKRIPYLRADSRGDVESFLGFRHVTGIKEWPAEQKAQFIASLIDERHMSYEAVMRKIGSRTRTVRQNYISYRLLLQMEDCVDEFSVADVEGRFSVMYLSLRTQGVQNYLHIDISADAQSAKTPVPETHIKNLANFALWLFGNKKKKEPSLFGDSRRVDDFGKILESSEAIRYLEENKRPDFDHAFELAGGRETQIVQRLRESANNVKLVLSRVHHYRDSEDIQEAVEELGTDVRQLLSIFPRVSQKLQGQEGDN